VIDALNGNSACDVSSLGISLPVERAEIQTGPKADNGYNARKERSRAPENQAENPQLTPFNWVSRQPPSTLRL
jgi:hypothetical protein